MLAKKISSHLKRLAKKSQAIKNQFIAAEEEESPGQKLFLDPLGEEKYTTVKGLVHKYKNRVLVLLTLKCAAYCRFCTRRRCVSDIKRGIINEKDLLTMKDYIKANSSIKEVILSGGDPFAVPDVLIKALKIFGNLSQIKVIRIGTRVPVSEPSLVTNSLLGAFKDVRQPLYILIHFEHPDELTRETRKVVAKLRKAGAILLSQTVFLKGINDSFKILYKLFSQLIELGVKPYYLFRCDPVLGAGKFRVPFEKEVEIATKLKKELSGLAYPLYVIDAPNGSGKIPVPLNFWKFNNSFYRDFLGKKLRVI